MASAAPPASIAGNVALTRFLAKFMRDPSAACAGNLNLETLFRICARMRMGCRRLRSGSFYGLCGGLRRGAWVLFAANDRAACHHEHRGAGTDHGFE